MRNRIVLFLKVFLLGPVLFSPAAEPARHVVVMVWDGMRPDFVSEQNTPTLYELSRKGVTFANHHPVYLSSTEVNGTALSTGAYPSHDGIIGNSEYRPAIDPLKLVHTEAVETVRKGDFLTHGNYVQLPTLAEIIRQGGRKSAVAGAKPVILLADRAARSSLAGGATVFAGATLPAELVSTLTNKIGPFPSDTSTLPTRNDWTTEAMLEVLWADGVPDFSFLWMNQPDVAQHQTGPGSKQSLEAIRNADANLARVLQALEAKGVRAKTDILVVSDHGFSTQETRVDLAEDLQKAGLNALREFKSKPIPGQVLIVSNSGSSLIYVVGHEQEAIRKIVKFLQLWPHTGVIFARKEMPGTFPLSRAQLDSADAPDVLVSMRWNANKSTNGTPGLVTSDLGLLPGQGTHVTLSRYDMHNTLIAAGPDFRPGVVSTLASGNVDIAPTVLHIFGIAPAMPMDGRILTEALTIGGPALRSFEPRHFEASNGGWRQYLNVTEVNGVTYIDEGNRLN